MFVNDSGMMHRDSYDTHKYKLPSSLDVFLRFFFQNEIRKSVISIFWVFRFTEQSKFIETMNSKRGTKYQGTYVQTFLC